MKAIRFFTAALAVAAVFGLQPFKLYAAENSAVSCGDIVIVYTNDVHCGVTPVINNKDGTVTNIGYAGVAGFVDYAESIAGEDNVTLVDAGDAGQGDAIGTMSKGQYLVDIINKMGYDIFVPGNHEFDYGMEQMLLMMEQIDGTVISSNFMDLAANEPVFDSYKIISYDDVDVAFVGITTPESFTRSNPSFFQDKSGNYIYGFKEGNNGADLYETVQTAVDSAVSEGADYVIAVGHLGIDSISDPWRSTDVIANTTGIDAFIDGHSHSVVEGDIVLNADGEDVLLTQTGTKLANVGCMTISADGTISSELISGYNNINEGMAAFVTSKMNEFAEDLKKVVGHTDFLLAANDPAVKEPKLIIRTQETNLGDIAADAYRYVLGNGAGEPADIAFVNSGGLRADIPAGDITFGQIINVHPYNNIGMVVEATGSEILDALEMGAHSAPGASGGFLQVSGLTYTIDTGIASSVELNSMGEFAAVNGERRVKNVMVGGKEIDPSATYTLASHDFMLLSGGNGITMFKDNKVIIQPVIPFSQILISYIQDYFGGAVGEEYANPYGVGRIKII